MLLGEVLDFDPNKVGPFQQQHDFDTLFDFPMCGAIKGTLVWDRPMTDLARPRLQPRRAAWYSGPGNALHQRQSAGDLAGQSRLGPAHHDRNLGSRRRPGSRNSACRILKMCVTFLFTTRGIPQIYYGTEIGLEGRKDPDNRRDMPWEIFDADNRPALDHAFERDTSTRRCA